MFSLPLAPLLVRLVLGLPGACDTRHTLPPSLPLSRGRLLRPRHSVPGPLEARACEGTQRGGGTSVSPVAVVTVTACPCPAVTARHLAASASAPCPVSGFAPRSRVCVLPGRPRLLCAARSSGGHRRTCLKGAVTVKRAEARATPVWRLERSTRRPWLAPCCLTSGEVAAS